MNTLKTETVSMAEAKEEVEISVRRTALLHLSYAKTLIQELGEEKGTRLIMKAIKDYGICIGERTKKEIVDQRLETSPENFGKGNYLRVPKLGHHERSETCKVKGEKRTRVYGCAMDKLWKEYGKEKLGRLYCFVDPAKYMAYNSRYKLIHIKALPDGDSCCEMAVRPTTKKERSDFISKDKDWSYLDRKKARQEIALDASAFLPHR